MGFALVALAVPRVAPQPTSARSELVILTKRPIVLSIATTAVGFAGVGVVFTYITPLLTEISGFAAPVVSGLLLVYGLGSLLGNIVGGKFADLALGATLRWVFGGLTLLLAVLPLALTWQPTAVVAVVALGILAAATVAPLQSLLLGHAGAAPTVAVTVNVAAVMLAHAAGAVIGGGIVSVGGLRWIGVAAAVLTAGGLVLSYLTAPARNSSTPERAAA
jgi:DHA1 family inner membrane transport protein